MNIALYNFKAADAQFVFMFTNIGHNPKKQYGGRNGATAVIFCLTLVPQQFSLLKEGFSLVNSVTF